VAADGSIRVPLGSDAGGLLTQAFLIANSGTIREAVGRSYTTRMDLDVSGSYNTYYIPVILGLTYTSEGQLLRPVTETELKTQSGPMLGVPKRIHQFSMHLYNTQQISVQTNGPTAYALTLANAAGTPLAENVLFSGIYYHDSIDDDFSSDSQFTWTASGPYPCNVMAVGLFLETGSDV
jgi:hypothetical protein